MSKRKKSKKNKEVLSEEVLAFIKEQKRKEHKEKLENKFGCRIAKCHRCGKEIYFAGIGTPLCKECRQHKRKKKLLDEQYRIAAKLGLLNNKK